jgi:hypothetical protein
MTGSWPCKLLINARQPHLITPPALIHRFDPRPNGPPGWPLVAL